MKYIIVFYTSTPRGPELFVESDMEILFARIVELTKKSAKFAIYKIDKCVGDYS